MSSNLTLVSWCPGGKCDPCHKPTVHVFIVGNVYNTGLNDPVVYLATYTEFSTPTLLTLSGTIIITSTSLNSKVPLQQFKLAVSASGYFQYGENAISSPLPATDTGINAGPGIIITESVEGPVVDSGPLAFSVYEVTK